MRNHRHAVAALLALLVLLGVAHADPLPPGTYPGYLIINPDGSQSIRAAPVQVVTMRQVTITHAGSGAAFGTTTGAGTYQHGATVTLTASAASGTTFTGWTGDAACSSTPFTITADLRCVAHFSKTPALTLTIAHSGTGTGTTTPVPGTTSTTEGTTITLTASAAGGSTFGGWSPHPCAASFPMPATDLTCTAAFNASPTTFILATAVVGSGTVSGAGNYLAGATVTLTAAPGAGAVFSGWSPSPCAPTFTMPAANLECTATFTALPPPTNAGTWALLPSGSASDPQPSSGGWQPWAYNYTDQSIWYYNSGLAGKVFRFSFSTNKWTVVSNSNVAGAIHNCGLAYIGPLAELGMGGCAPDAGQTGEWRIPTTGGSAGQMTFLTTVWPLGADPLCAYDRTNTKVQCLGGWGSDPNVYEKPGSPFSTTWTKRTISATRPGLVAGDAGADTHTRTTYNRGAWSTAMGKLWVVDGAADFWTFDTGAGTWTKLSTSGTKPPSNTIYALHESSNTVVGFSTCNADTGSCGGASQTYLLNRLTGIWSLGPGPAQGPPVASYVAANILHHEGRSSIILIEHSGGIPQLWEFVPGTTPPDPVATFTFTVAKTGSGTGTLGGGGTYPTGTVVTATATPDSTSVMNGWVEAACPTFTLTANSTCTARLDPKPGVPSGPYPDLPTLPQQAFVPVACGPVTAAGAPIYDLSPWPCSSGSKHQRWAADRAGNVWTGFGDTSPSNHGGNPSQNQGYKLRTRDGQWTRWNAACRPAGQLQPSYPDEVPWAYDTRGYFWLLPGVLQAVDGATCSSGGGESGSTLYKTGLFKYVVATDLWERITGPAGTNALRGVFDNTTKSLLYAGGGGTGACGAALFKLNVDTLAVTSINLCLSANPFPGSPPNTFEDYADVRVAPIAFDETGRRLYVLGYHNPFVAGAQSGQPVVRLWAVNVDTGAISQMATPPNVTNNEYRNPDAQEIVFDTTNRRVIFPYTRTHCGVVEAMYSYEPTGNAWTTHSVTPTTAVPGGFVRANSAVYDPYNNVVVLGGTVACGDWGFPGQPNLTHWFLWRYAP